MKVAFWNRIGKWLAAVAAVLLAMPMDGTLGAQEVSPLLQVARFPQGSNLWRVDIYMAVPRNWVTRQGLSADEMLQWRIMLEADSPDKSQLVVEPFKISHMYGYALDTELLEFGKTLSLPAGKYRLQTRLERQGGVLYAWPEQSVELTNVADDGIQVSDFVPVKLPQVGPPPFETVLWMDGRPVDEDFYLFYEVSSAVPDTFITFVAQVVDEAETVILQDQYRLYVGDLPRRDFLRVQAEVLPDGNYALILRVGGNNGIIKKRIAFQVKRALTITQRSIGFGIAWKRQR